MTRNLVARLAMMTVAAVVFTVGASRPTAADGPAFVGYPCPSNSALTCVMKGLNGARGLVFGPEGALYVAEAGKGGQKPCIIESGTRVCYGATGAVTRLLGDVQEKVITDLPSIAINDPLFPLRTGQTANGPTDLAFGGIDDDDAEAGETTDGWTTYITIGLRNNPAVRDDLKPVGDQFARLLRVGPNGKRRFVADLGTYEIEANSGGGTIDSNPFGLLAEHGSRLVVDAGANALLRVAGNGHGPISTVATFPSRAQGQGTDAVPTSVAVGPDGAYYVSELKGIPFATWDSNVYRVVPGEAPTVYLHGFKMIIDLAFDSDWNLYVLQYGTVTGASFGRSGVLTRVAPDGTRTMVISGLQTPSSVAVGADGFVYVANRGNFPDTGEVIRVAAPTP